MEIDTIVCGDFLDVAPTLPDSCLDLSINDLPYFKIKKEWWDNQWDSVDGYLKWLDKCCQQWYRLLKPNGSLYVFASPKMAARVEVKLSGYFNVLNRIRWIKEAGWHKKAVKDELRSYLSPWEEIIFAEHCGADSAAKGESGYGVKCDQLRGFVFEPLRAYLDGERRRAELSMSNVDKAWQGIRGTKGCMTPHWFGASQWGFPTKEHYQFLSKLFNSKGRQPAPPHEDYHAAPRSRFEHDHDEREYLRAEYEDLRAEYEDLRAEYEDLRAEYEDLRRPFNVTAQDQYTDVWEFPTVKAYPGKHPTEKPLEMLEHIIRASSRPGDLVADFFCGSGVTAEAAMRQGRHYFCSDIMQTWVDFSQQRVAKAKLEMSQLTLPEIG